MNALLEHFLDMHSERGMRLDGFQIDACRELADGSDVLVCAPTGSGKTVVAHFAAELALAGESRCVYTAPIKALSNQKYAELAERHGERTVGLLTGDATVNRDAAILVVTTEVLRNMLFANSAEISDIGYVVLDEIHYLADRERGPVWEEVVLALPERVRLVSLSATMANAEELAGWLRSVRGRTSLIASDVRPVPLVQHVAVGQRLFRLHGEHPGEPLGALVSALDGVEERHTRLGPRDRRRILGILSERDMLPAIEFVFSRKGCDQAVAALLRSDVTLTSRAERREIHRRIGKVRGLLDESDRRAIGFEQTAKALVHGYGVHHAGVYPALKELTERLMDAGLLRLVYATGTLALGIDMPVRSVVLESLGRWDGAGFVDLTATEYTQLIGRAGRRGKDDVGHAIVVADRGLDPHALADLGSGRAEPLRSAFFPSYNAVVNLLAERSYAQARDIVGRSFAQYQRNADLGRIEARLARIRRKISREEGRLTCDRGDLVEFLRLRSASGRAAKSARKAARRAHRERIASSFAGARNGVLYAVRRGGDLDYVLVLSTDRTRLRVIDWYGEVSWLYEADLGSQLREVGAIAVPRGRSLRDRSAREDLADAILAEVEERVELGVDRDLLDSWSRLAVGGGQALAHPCAACPDLDAHLREAETMLSLDARAAELAELERNYTDSVGREFDATAAVLLEVGILVGEGEDVRPGPGAPALRALHLENDLLAHTCLSILSEGELDAADFAGWASMFLGDDRLAGPRPLGGTLGRLAGRASAEADRLRRIESRHGICRTREVGVSLAEAFSAWARGASLEACLRMSTMAAGDFVGAARRLVDLLGQMSVAGDGTWIEELAREARARVRRNEVL